MLLTLALILLDEDEDDDEDETVDELATKALLRCLLTCTELLLLALLVDACDCDGNGLASLNGECVELGLSFSFPVEEEAGGLEATGGGVVTQLI